ncbi:MAG: hypothetical protein HXY41_08460 [Chloroflexi bacterium]|nr:hypothetical protein [Chloroflexota bacterium]
MPQKRKGCKLFVFDLIAPWLLVAAMLYMLRRLERWLHQHIFKVGWLVTKQLQTTTILFYAFFLPGIVLHEFTYWLVAGLLNVRADRALEWPKKQEVAELKLNFVRLTPKTGAIRLAIITISPFIVGVLLIWLIANTIINIQEAAASLQSGFLTDVSQMVSRLTATPDFWLWIYLIFTIGNTLSPSNPEHLRGWQRLLPVAGVILLVLIFLGAADEVLVNALASLNATVNSLSGTLGVIIVVDLFMVAILGTVEAIIERITGHSATYKDGKLITMRRSELMAQRAAEMKKGRAPQKAARAAPAGPPSVYRFALPIPGAPGKEAISRADDRIIAPQEKPLPSPLAPTPGRDAPAVISGAAAPKPDETPPDKDDPH